MDGAPGFHTLVSGLNLGLGSASDEPREWAGIQLRDDNGAAAPYLSLGGIDRFESITIGYTRPGTTVILR